MGLQISSPFLPLNFASYMIRNSIGLGILSLKSDDKRSRGTNLDTTGTVSLSICIKQNKPLLRGGGEIT